MSRASPHMCLASGMYLNSQRAKPLKERIHIESKTHTVRRYSTPGRHPTRSWPEAASALQRLSGGAAACSAATRPRRTRGSLREALRTARHCLHDRDRRLARTQRVADLLAEKREALEVQLAAEQRHVRALENCLLRARPRCELLAQLRERDGELMRLRVELETANARVSADDAFVAKLERKVPMLRMAPEARAAEFAHSGGDSVSSRLIAALAEVCLALHLGCCSCPTACVRRCNMHILWPAQHIYTFAMLCSLSVGIISVRVQAREEAVRFATDLARAQQRTGALRTQLRDAHAEPAQLRDGRSAAERLVGQMHPQLVRSCVEATAPQAERDSALHTLDMQGEQSQVCVRVSSSSIALQCVSGQQDFATDLHKLTQASSALHTRSLWILSMAHELETLCRDSNHPAASKDVAAKLFRHGVQSHGDAGDHGAGAAYLDERDAHVPATFRRLQAGLSSAKVHVAALPSDLDAPSVGSDDRPGGVQQDSVAALVVVGQRLELS